MTREQLIDYCVRKGFRRLYGHSWRLFLPVASSHDLLLAETRSIKLVWRLQTENRL